MIQSNPQIYAQYCESNNLEPKYQRLEEARSTDMNMKRWFYINQDNTKDWNYKLLILSNDGKDCIITSRYPDIV